MPDNEVEIDAKKLRYFCSNCGAEFTSNFGAQRHIDRTDCKSAGATVRTVASDDIVKVAKQIVESHEPQTEQKSEPRPAATVSQAERAAVAPLPPWAVEHLRDEETEQPEEGEEQETYLPPFAIKPTSAALAIQPSAWLIVLYEASLARGYVGSMGDFVHESIAQLCIMYGIKIEILGVTPDKRQRLLEEAGLADASR